MQTKKQSKHDKTGRIALHFVNIWIVKEGKLHVRLKALSEVMK